MRAISPHLRRELEEPRSDEYVVVLLEISHTELAEPIRVANDVVDYSFEGNTYVGFPFQIEIIGDTAQVPRGQVTIQNVDQRITEAVLGLTTPPTLRILLFAQSDFADIGGDVTVRTTSASPEYEAPHLIFGNVTVDALQISGEIQSFDMSNEPWPAIRSTADRLPGLEP